MPVVNTHLVYPMCAMFALSVVVLAKMFMARYNAVKSGQMKLGYFKTFTGAECTEDVVKTGRQFTNLFEAPVLFYIACLIAMILPVEGFTFLVLAWVYVAVRIVHAYIHMGANKVMIRMRVYGVSWLVLIAMWILIFAKALAISAIA